MTNPIDLIHNLNDLMSNPSPEYMKTNHASRYFNTSGIGLPFRSATDITRQYRAYFEEFGILSAYTQSVVDHLLESTRNAIANMIGASADEIALTQNATEGIQGVFVGMSFEAGNRVLLGCREHPSVRLLARHVERFGAEVVYVDTSLSPFTQTIPENVTFAALSVVTYISGRRLHSEWPKWLRENGIHWLADATQAVGQVHLRTDELGCDFLVSSGHKWMHGSVGTGFLFVRQSSFGLLRHYPQAWRSVEYHCGQIFDHPTAVRFEKATQDLSAFAGLAVISSWVTGGIWQEQVTLKRQELTMIFKDNFRKPEDVLLIHDTGGVIGIEGEIGIFDAVEVAKMSYDEFGWIIKSMDLAEFAKPALRISLSVNNEPSETEALAKYLTKMLSRGRNTQ